jgi:hypothetical protein
MTPERLRELLDEAGLGPREAAAVLGYRNHNSVRQCLSGRATLPPSKAAWLKRYVKLRAKHRAVEERHRELEQAWLEKNPPPA